MPAATPRIDSLDRNYIINGNFALAQRATSASISGSNAYVSLDRFTAGIVGTVPTNKTFARTATVPAGSKSKYSAIFSSDTGVSLDTGYSALQRIESILSRELAGEKASFSFQINSSHHQAVRIIMSYPTAEDNYASVIGFLDETLPITQGSFVEVSLENITIPLSAVNGIQFEIRVIDILSASTNTAIIHNLKLNKGNKKQEFSYCGRNQVEEISLCQRYFEKTYDIDVAVGASNFGGAQVAGANASSIIWKSDLWTTRKRVTPVFHIYSPFSGAIDNIYRSTGGDTAGIVYQAVSTTGAMWELTGISTTTRNRYHWTADSEL